MEEDLSYYIEEQLPVCLNDFLPFEESFEIIDIKDSFRYTTKFAPKLKSYLKISSALLPSKHLNLCLGLLRSRSDPVRKSKIKKDKASTSILRLFNQHITYPISLPKAHLQMAKSYPASLVCINIRQVGFLSFLGLKFLSSLKSIYFGNSVSSLLKMCKASAG